MFFDMSTDCFLYDKDLRHGRVLIMLFIKVYKNLSNFIYLLWVIAIASRVFVFQPYVCSIILISLQFLWPGKQSQVLHIQFNVCFPRVHELELFLWVITSKHFSLYTSFY